MEDEGYIEVPGGKVWYQSVGGGDGTPLLCLHGGPGFTHHYLERLADLGDRRRVVFYDQLGCGSSDRPDDASLWTVERFVEELAVVRHSLGLDDLHLFGSSWGGMLAMQYVLDLTPPLRSLILCGSPASIPRWIRECAALLEAEPEAVRATIRDHEARGFTACPEYQSAILGFYRKHVCRLDPWPEGLERSFAEAGYQVYETMNLRRAARRVRHGGQRVSRPDRGRPAPGGAGLTAGRGWRRSRRSAISRSSAKVIFRLPGSPGTTATSRSV
jgi:proline iminopeptidase